MYWIIVLIGVVIWQRFMIRDLRERNEWQSTMVVPDTLTNLFGVPAEDLGNLPDEAKQEVLDKFVCGDYAPSTLTDEQRREISDFRKKWGL